MEYEEWHGERGDDKCLQCGHPRRCHIERGSAGYCTECRKETGPSPPIIFVTDVIDKYYHNFVVRHTPEGQSVVQFEPWQED